MKSIQVLPDFPKIVQIEPTNHCNLRCTMCPRQASTYPEGFMDYSLFTKIVDQCKKVHTHINLYFLGEPLLHPRLEEMMKYIADASISLGIATNGLLVTPEKAEFLVKYANPVTVSIDAYNSAQYASMRGGDYKKVVANVKLLCKTKHRISRNTRVNIATVIPNNPKAASDQVRGLLQEWIRTDVKLLIQELHRYGKHAAKKDRNYVCMDGLSRLIMRWDGKITFCCGDMNTVTELGNAGNSTLHDVWFSDELNSIKEKILDKKYEEIPACSKCTVYYHKQILLVPPKLMSKIA